MLLIRGDSGYDFVALYLTSMHSLISRANVLKLSSSTSAFLGLLFDAVMRPQVPFLFIFFIYLIIMFVIYTFLKIYLYLYLLITCDNNVF